MLVVVVHDVYEKLFDVVRGIRRGLLFGAVRSWYGGGWRWCWLRLFLAGFADEDVLLLGKGEYSRWEHWCCPFEWAMLRWELVLDLVAEPASSLVACERADCCEALDEETWLLWWYCWDSWEGWRNGRLLYWLDQCEFDPRLEEVDRLWSLSRNCMESGGSGWVGDCTKLGTSSSSKGGSCWSVALAGGLSWWGWSLFLKTSEIPEAPSGAEDLARCDWMSKQNSSNHSCFGARMGLKSKEEAVAIELYFNWKGEDTVCS